MMNAAGRAALLVAVPAAITAVAVGQGGPPPTPVTVDAVRVETVQEHRKVTGELSAVRRSRVATEEPGLVVELPVREGTRVAAGDVLARLDSARLELALKQARAEESAAAATVEERKALLSWRQRELELYRSSAERGAANVKEVLDAESQQLVASALAGKAQRELEVAGARVELLEKRVADMTVAAPFDGVVVALHTELGEWVGEGDGLLELVSVSELEAWLDVPQQHFQAVIGHAEEISIRLDATGAQLPIGQARIVPVVDPRARSFEVIAALADDAPPVAPGMSVTAWIPTTAMAERKTVHKDALLRNDAGSYVYAVRGEGVSAEGGAGRAMPVPVVVLFPVGERVIVESPGLMPDDLVVVEGNERLFPMTPVTANARGAGASQARLGGPR